MSLLSICTTVCILSVRNVDHHDCVCVITINKSLCQVCVCISESGRNKTQLAGKKDSLSRKKTLAKLASKFKKLLANSKFHSHLASCYFHPCVLPPLAVNSKSERKVNSLPPLGFEPVIFGMLAHHFNHSAKSHQRIFRLLTSSKSSPPWVVRFSSLFTYYK
jgi:hypothetical protein